MLIWFAVKLALTFQFKPTSRRILLILHKRNVLIASPPLTWNTPNWCCTHPDNSVALTSECELLAPFRVVCYVSRTIGIWCSLSVLSVKRSRAGCKHVQLLLRYLPLLPPPQPLNRHLQNTYHCSCIVIHIIRQARGVTDSYCCVGKLLSPDKELWLWPSSLCIILFLILCLMGIWEGGGLSITSWWLMECQRSGEEKEKVEVTVRSMSISITTFRSVCGIKTVKKIWR